MPALSVVIPANREMFLARTVQGVLDAIRGDTEIIVVLDGAWADPQLPVDERVTVIYNHEAVGQRAATNQAARLAQGKWIMKLDAHCSVDEGFDVKLLAGAQEDWTLVPTMYNLHAFDRVCWDCGMKLYQGPTDVLCDCGGVYVREIVWHAKPSPETTAMRFDKDLRFQYWGGFKERQGGGDYVETMSLLGACWALTRERYWQLNICDEELGSWGQQGTEVACKTWLSGGKLMCCRTTWFGHLFRTQGGDFGFPYPQSGRQIDHARAQSKRLFALGEWDGAKHPLSWLIERFSPVPDWDHAAGKSVVYYTDNRLNVRLAKRVQRRIEQSGLPIVSVSLKPMPHFGRNVHLTMQRGVLTMFKQILAGLEASEADFVFFCEHDVLYHPSHFDFLPPRDDTFYYNTNVFRVREDGFAVRTTDCRQTSGLCAGRELLLQHYRERVRRVEADGFSRRMGFEPGTHRRAERVDDFGSERWESAFPNLDIRHAGALTPSRWSPDQYRNKRYAEGWTETTAAEIPGWESLKAA